MKDEIKEILDRLECDKDDVYYVGYTDGVNIDNTLMPKDIKLLLDYITNLQKENERLKVNCNLGYEELKVMRDYKSRIEKAIEYIKEQDMSYYGAVVNTKVEIILNILGGKNE